MIRESKHRKLKLKRLKTGIIGFLAGICLGIPVTYLIDGVYFNLFTVMCGAVGLGAVMSLFERTRDFPTGDDVKEARFKEELSPLGIENHHSSKQL